MGGETARFVQYVRAIPIRPELYYYSGWFATGGVRCDYWFKPRPDDEARLTVLKYGGETIVLGKKEREFLLRKLTGFSGAGLDPQSRPSDERSLARSCSILGHMTVRRKLELTPETLEILTGPKFGCSFE